MSIEQITRAGNNDQPELHQLWETVFNDSPDIVESFFEHFPPEISGWVLRRDNRICSAAYMLPGNWYLNSSELRPAAYVYAVATKPSERGKGYAGRLMQAIASFAEERGLLLYTRPAESSLFRWYAETMGTKNTGYYQETKYVDVPVIHTDSLRRLTPDEYGQAREKLLAETPHIILSENFLRLQESYSDGYYALEESCCCVIKNQNHLLIPEILSPDSESGLFVQSILSHFQMQNAVLRSNEHSNDIPGVAYSGPALPPETNWGLWLE